MRLDVGSKTVGVAIGDPLSFTVQDVEIIRIDKEAGEFGFERLEELVKQYKVDKFVIGLSKNMNNIEDPRVEANKTYGDKINEFSSVPINYQNERLTTVQAKRMLVGQADVSRGKCKKVIDRSAA